MGGRPRRRGFDDWRSIGEQPADPGGLGRRLESGRWRHPGRAHRRPRLRRRQHYAGLGVVSARRRRGDLEARAGVPDGILGFKVAADPTDPRTFYAATGGGLFRSDRRRGDLYERRPPDRRERRGGPPNCTGRRRPSRTASWPTWSPTSSSRVRPTPSPGGKPGAVMAAVGWRAGDQATSRRLALASRPATASTSPTRRAGHLHEGRHGDTFPNGATRCTQERSADRARRRDRPGPGPPAIVYAIVQDAVKFNGGVIGSTCQRAAALRARPATPQRRLGIDHFGQPLEAARGLDDDRRRRHQRFRAGPAGLQGADGLLLPGRSGLVQPLGRAGSDAPSPGVPTRLVFGLEEFWSNGRPTPPTGLDGNGRYFTWSAATSPAAMPDFQPPNFPLPSRGHQPEIGLHDAPGPACRRCGSPTASGGVTLVVGNDGGVYKQHVAAGAATPSPHRVGSGQAQGRQRLRGLGRQRWPEHPAAVRRGRSRTTEPPTWACRTTVKRKIEPDGTYVHGLRWRRVLQRRRPGQQQHRLRVIHRRRDPR